MVTQKNPRWDFQVPMYGARITLSNEKPLFKMSPADERERQHNRKRIMGKKSRRFFKVVDTEAPLANSFQCHPLDTPDQLFVPTNNWGLVPQTRFVHHFDEAMVLVQTDGACRDNGRPNAKAASAVVYAPHNPLTGTEGVFSFPLRDKRDATSNRAEMIAVLAAIRCRNWKAEGFSRLVIGTDSEWIVKGATMYVRKWQSKNWRTASGEPVKNRDLWQELSESCSIFFDFFLIFF